MTAPEHPRVAEVARLLREAGATGEVRHLPDSARTAAAAAAQLGVEVGAIANSLVFDVGGNPLLVLTSGAHRVEESLVATLLGVPAITRATPEFVRRHTGQAIGGVAPIGHPEPIGTLVDIELARSRAGLGGRRAPAHRLPHDLRRAAPADRRHPGRGGPGSRHHRRAATAEAAAR